MARVHTQCKALEIFVGLASLLLSFVVMCILHHHLVFLLSYIQRTCNFFCIATDPSLAMLTQAQICLESSSILRLLLFVPGQLHSAFGAPWVTGEESCARKSRGCFSSLGKGGANC